MTTWFSNAWLIWVSFFKIWNIKQGSNLQLRVREGKNGEIFDFLVNMFFVDVQRTSESKWTYPIRALALEIFGEVWLRVVHCLGVIHLAYIYLPSILCHILYLKLAIHWWEGNDPFSPGTQNRRANKDVWESKTCRYMGWSRQFFHWEKKNYTMEF